MRYCLKFILPLIQLVFVQCNDDHRNHFYENLFQSSNSTSVTTNISQLASSQGYNKLVHFQTRTERPTTFVSTFTRSKRHTIHYKYYRVNRQMCGSGPYYWHCPRDEQCGKYSGCVGSSPTHDYFAILAGIFIPLICCLSITCFCIKYNCNPPCCPRTNSTSEHLQRHLETTQRPLENLSLQRENLHMTTPLRNTINSTAHQSSTIDCFLERVAITYSTEQTSRKPPSYDDLVRLNLITDSMAQQSLLLPPTYDDFMRRNNQREV